MGRLPKLAGLLLLTACSATTESSHGDRLHAAVALDGDHALVGRLLIEHDGSDPVEVTVRGEERTFALPIDDRGAEELEVAVAGLRAESHYEVEVRAGDEVEVLALRTGALPARLDSIEVTTSTPDDMSPGFTLFNVLDVTDQLTDQLPAEPPQSGLLVAVDAAGQVVWYHQEAHPIGDVRQLDDGTLLYEYNDTGARRIDLFGDVLDEWAGRIITGPLATDTFGRRVTGPDPVVVDTDSMHHEMSLLPSGNLLTISTELRTVEGFPQPLCGDDPAEFDGSYDLISDVIVEFTPDGQVVERYPLADLLDPVGDARDDAVCGLPFDQVFPNWLYRAQGYERALDWTHANSVVLDPDGDALTVSVRHLDTVLQIDRATGQLLWRFGPGGDFSIVDPADLAYHQHAPEWQEDGTLLVYDNGNGRPGTGDPASGMSPPYSRAVQYRLDPTTGVAQVVWQHVAELAGAPVFAPFVGDADRLPNGNVLITHGGLGADHPSGVSAQIIEVIPDGSETGGRTVFDLRLADPDRALAIYRAERMDSLYAG